MPRQCKCDLAPWHFLATSSLHDAGSRSLELAFWMAGSISDAKLRSNCCMMSIMRGSAWPNMGPGLLRSSTIIGPPPNIGGKRSRTNSAGRLDRLSCFVGNGEPLPNVITWVLPGASMTISSVNPGDGPADIRPLLRIGAPPPSIPPITLANILSSSASLPPRAGPRMFCREPPGVPAAANKSIRLPPFISMGANSITPAGTSALRAGPKTTPMNVHMNRFALSIISRLGCEIEEHYKKQGWRQL
mmetsp:Transcript_8481/g.13555  ORF Transcript_8481/g.13555 Transcript_8481/m.13555 type:complete len:245 (-) Transcript_8481:72-806(-)